MAHAGPVERMITGTKPGRSVATRFVAGDGLDDAMEVSRTLNEGGFLVSLDMLGEEVHDEGSTDRAAADYLASLDRIHLEGLNANVSVKPTQLGLAIDPSLAAAKIDLLATRAAELGTTVTLDMEDSRYTEATIDLYEEGQQAHGNLGIALQAYLHRTPDDLSRLADLGGHIRLCKGAYVESEDVAFTHKAEVDAAFELELETLMAMESVRPAIATHDEALVRRTLELADHRDGPFEFQMLYGVRKDLQRQVLEQGHPLRVYLPFGSQWYPYLTRRLAERPANAWFFAKAALTRRRP